MKRHRLDRYVNTVKGPLLRATAQGSTRTLTHMGLKPGSTYASVPTALFKAWKRNDEEGIVDEDLDKEGRDVPLFGNHGNRRYSDRRAQDSMDVTGVTMGQINDHFGWDQKARRKQSALHYHGRLERLKRAKVTMMI